MARGKHATKSANRRQSAERDHIDRLTDQLAEAKLRARRNEQLAAQVPMLRARIGELTQQIEDDELLAESIEALRRWKQIATADQKRRAKAWREVGKMLADFRTRMLLSQADSYEFFLRRYPAIFRALVADDNIDTTQTVRQYSPLRTAGMTDEQVKRWQRAAGTRAVHEFDNEADAADVMIDWLDAKQASFSTEEIHEYIGMEADA